MIGWRFVITGAIIGGLLGLIVGFTACGIWP